MSKNTEKEALIAKIVDAIQDTKGEDIAGNVEKKVRNELQDRPWHVEGSENAMWVLVDYISVVVHVFQKHIREYYDIEELWGDAKVITVEN